MATIEARNTENGTVAYRAKVRIKGFPAQSATFERKTDAREWAKQTEAPAEDLPVATRKSARRPGSLQHDGAQFRTMQPS